MRKGIATAVAFTVWLVPAAPAAADLYVEHDAPAGNTACTQQDPCDRINDAVFAAGNGDTIHIGPGSYSERIETQTRLTFKGGGAGPRDAADLSPYTVVTGQPNLGSTFRLSGGGAISGIRVSGQPQGASVPGGTAIELRSFPGTPREYALSGVVALGGSPTTIGQGTGRALYAEGSSGGAVSVAVTDSVLAQDDDDGANTTPTVDVRAGASLDISRSTIDPGNRGIGIIAFGDGLHADGIEILNRSPTRFGVEIAGRATIVRSRIAADEMGAFVPGGPLELRDSVVTTTRETTTAFPVVSVWVSGESHRTDFTATGSTLLTRGPDVDSGLELESINPGGIATADVRNTVIRATDTAGDPGDADVATRQSGGGTSSVTASNSSYTDVRTLGGGSIPPPGSGTNLAGDPGFTNEAALDLTLAPASPLIDRGDPAFVEPGELDFAGASRALDGRGDCGSEPDVGAFERPAIAATGCTPPGGPGGPAGPGPPTTPDTNAPVFESRLAVTNKVFRNGTPAARIARARPGTRFVYRISEAGTARFAIEQKASGRRAGRACKKPTRKNRRGKRCTRWVPVGSFNAPAAAGANRTPFTGTVGKRKLHPGSYRARATVADAAQNRSAESKVVFRIVSR